MSQNFARFVGQFGIKNPIILGSFKFSVPLLKDQFGTMLTILTFIDKLYKCYPYWPIYTKCFQFLPNLTKWIHSSPYSPIHSDLLGPFITQFDTVWSILTSLTILIHFHQFQSILTHFDPFWKKLLSLNMWFQ